MCTGLYKHSDENLFVDFLEWDAVVVATLNCFNNKTRGLNYESGLW